MQDFIEDEYPAFPVSTYDDMLDCLSIAYLRRERTESALARNPPLETVEVEAQAGLPTTPQAICTPNATHRPGDKGVRIRQYKWPRTEAA
jgi:hypothetical protein